VVPITSNLSRLYPCEAYLLLNGEQRKAMADQIATISKQRLKGFIGNLSRGDMAAVERGLRCSWGSGKMMVFVTAYPED
jgi:mRNA interferase MazF